MISTSDTKPWDIRKSSRSYSRDEWHRETYSKQDPEKFLRSNWGVKQEDGSWIITKDLILLKNSPIVKNGKFIVNIKRVERNFNCSGQSLTTLKGGPEYVGGNFWCGSNPRLKSLKHGPKYVGGTYDCSYNNLKSLSSLPDIVFNDLDVSGNKLRHMRSFPSFVKGELNMSENLLETLEGMPQTGKEANFLDNPLRTLYGFKIPLGNDIVRFNGEDDEGNRLTGTEIDYVLHQQYDLKKPYKNYYYHLLFLERPQYR